MKNQWLEEEETLNVVLPLKKIKTNNKKLQFSPAAWWAASQCLVCEVRSGAYPTAYGVLGWGGSLQ